MPAIERLAAAMGYDPELRFRPSDERLRRDVARLQAMTPEQRVLVQDVVVEQVAAAMLAEEVPFALTGAAGAALHAIPVTVDVIDVLVRDDDAAMEAFGRVLLATFRLFAELTPAQLRDHGEERGWEWHMSGQYIRVQPVEVLPETTTVQVGRLPVPVVAVAELVAEDPDAQRAIDAVRALLAEDPTAPRSPREPTPRPDPDRLRAEDLLW